MSDITDTRYILTSYFKPTKLLLFGTVMGSHRILY